MAIVLMHSEKSPKYTKGSIEWLKFSHHIGNRCCWVHFLSEVELMHWLHIYSQYYENDLSCVEWDIKPSHYYLEHYLVRITLVYCFVCCVFRLEYEYVVKGYMFQKGRLKITVSKILKVCSVLIMWVYGILVGAFQVFLHFT